MIKPIADYQFSGFKNNPLSEMKPYFDIDFTACTLLDRAQWFENLYTVAQKDVGVAHCINQHQSSRNYLAIANKLEYEYDQQLGCMSTYHDIDTIKIINSRISGTKHWITALDRADYVICKVGHHSDPDRKLVVIKLSEIEHDIVDNGYNPIGVKIARPMSLVLPEQAFPDSWILDDGAFKETAQQNMTLSFSKYGFLTNFLGCAVGLFNAISAIADRKNYHLDYQLKTFQSQLYILRENWQKNFYRSKVSTLDNEYWEWYDSQYNHTKDILTNMLKLVVEIGSSRFYDSNDDFSQRFRDALVWNSHGKPHYEQVLLTKALKIN